MSRLLMASRDQNERRCHAPSTIRLFYAATPLFIWHAATSRALPLVSRARHAQRSRCLRQREVLTGCRRRCCCHTLRCLPSHSGYVAAALFDDMESGRRLRRRASSVIDGYAMRRDVTAGEKRWRSTGRFRHMMFCQRAGSMLYRNAASMREWRSVSAGVQSVTVVSLLTTPPPRRRRRPPPLYVAAYARR